MKWTLEEPATPNDATLDRLANAFLSGNGHLGLRATLDEHGAERKAGVLINGLYDQVPGRWREPVNAPHPINLRLVVDGIGLDAASAALSHTQSLDFRYGIQARTTKFAAGSATVLLNARRWVSRAHPHLLQAEWSIEVDRALDLEVRSGVDGNVWDLNGPHLEQFAVVCDGGLLGLSCQTQETKTAVTVVEVVDGNLGDASIEESTLGVARVWRLRTEPGRVYRLRKLAVVDSVAALEELAARGFDDLEAEHRRLWDEVWATGDVQIEGDEQAQTALRHSLYHLISTAPSFPHRAEGLSIPARGVSGQVYKGAVFWDTEIFMLPYFLNASPTTAKALLQYRLKTLGGALAKAREEGYLGAFYAWESQDGGRDACTLFNVNDVFTGRPLRTFFRDKQIHISADVALAIWDYTQVSGDSSLLDQGGGDVLLECARFFLSWLVWRPDRARFELLDVTGPDEYHERVDNDYWTNLTAWKTLRAAREVLGHGEVPAGMTTLRTRLDGVLAAFYLPQPDAVTRIIPQFDGYHRLEDSTPAVLKTRQKHPHEYWGCGDGLARWTQVIKQADVVLALSLFPEDHDEAIRRANWEFYEPRTEHGSSLSACAYAISAARLGKTDFAYRYFLKTATVDWTGDSKQYVGDLYIGGTHPAANGGAWMAVVLGFVGFQRRGRVLSFEPRLPASWREVRFTLNVSGQTIDAVATSTSVNLSARTPFETPVELRLGDRVATWTGGRPVCLSSGTDRTPLPMKGALFDLDGVLVDTAKYHFLAWRRLAESLGIAFDERDNEALKGVSRTESLERILAIGGVAKSAEEKALLCDQKNAWYVEMIGDINPSELLPGVVAYLDALRARGVKVALGSASKNAATILHKTGITHYFDAVIDGTKVSKSKPDPEVFLRGAEALGLAPGDCVVFEDSQSGVEAARSGGMASIGIGSIDELPEADVVVTGIGALL